MKNLWGLYLTYIHDLDKVLGDMEKKGVRIDLDAQSRLRSKVETEIQELLEKAQKLVPQEVCPTRIWKKLPKDRLVQEIQIPGKVKVCSHCGQQGVRKSDHFKATKEYLYDEEGNWVLNKKGKPLTKLVKNPCKLAGAEILTLPGSVPAWLEVLPFNPLSSKQMLAYCKFRKHPVQKHMRTGEETVNVKALEKLAKKFKDPLYALTLRMRGMQKVLGTYLYEPDTTGYAHGHFKHTPSTLRLAQANYNFMNISHRGTAIYAHEVREQMIPSPGCVFVEADYSSLEAVLVGYFMNDPVFLDLARKGIHAWLCCRELEWEFNPENSKKAKALHKPMYDRKKLSAYLSLYEGKPRLLAAQFPEFFPTLKDAEREQRAFLEPFPKLKEWWRQTKLLAQKQGYLQSPWGFRHYFYQVLRKEKKQDPLTGREIEVLVDAEDSNRAVAFQPQHAGGMIGRESLLLFGQTWLRPYMPSNGFIHDGWVFDVPEGRKSECIELIKKILPRPIVPLGGLRIGCEIGVGYRSWADMQTVETVVV